MKRAAATDCRPLRGLRAHYYRALGLTPQALCCRLLRRLKAKALIFKTPNNLVYRALSVGAAGRLIYRGVAKAGKSMSQKFFALGFF